MSTYIFLRPFCIAYIILIFVISRFNNEKIDIVLFIFLLPGILSTLICFSEKIRNYLRQKMEFLFWFGILTALSWFIFALIWMFAELKFSNLTIDVIGIIFMFFVNYWLISFLFWLIEGGLTTAINRANNEYIVNKIKEDLKSGSLIENHPEILEKLFKEDNKTVSNNNFNKSKLKITDILSWKKNKVNETKTK